MTHEPARDLDRLLADGLQRLQQRQDALGRPWDTEEELARALAGLSQAKRSHPSRGVRRWPFSDRVGQWSIAGAVVALCCVVLYGWTFTRSVAPPKTYTTTAGQRLTIRLADGSQVILAPGTTLSVPQTFNRTTRTVTIRGQAYFDIATSAGIPFVVQTGNVATQVLGTVFDVKRYATDRATRITVVRGKVQSRGLGSTQTLLTSGMVGLITDSTITRVSAGDVSSYTAWTSGHLAFRQAPVPDVLATMERWYGLRFQVTDSTLLADRISGDFDFESTSAALSYLKSLLDVHMAFNRHGDTTVVILQPRDRRTSPHITPIPARRERPRALSSSVEVGK